MTYKTIRNLNGNLIYIVNTEEEILNNSHLDCIICEDINLKLKEIQDAYLEQESYRFSIAKEVVNGLDTTWTNADIVNDDENGSYNVFNHFSGLHENISGLTNAKQRLEELKQETLLLAGLKEIKEIEFLPVPIVGPNSSTIPVAEL